MTVAIDGSGDYQTITAAVKNIPMNRKHEYVIFIKKGTYNESIYIGMNMSNSVTALGTFSRGFIKKYKLKQNLIKIKHDYIELPTKKNTLVLKTKKQKKTHKCIKFYNFFSTSFHILNHYKPSIFPKN